MSFSQFLGPLSGRVGLVGGSSRCRRARAARALRFESDPCFCHLTHFKTELVGRFEACGFY